MTTPCHALTHEQWTETMKTIYEKNGTESAVGELSYFCWQVLEKCGDTAELAAFLDERALKAFESVEKTNGSR